MVGLVEFFFVSACDNSSVGLTVIFVDGVILGWCEEYLVGWLDMKGVVIGDTDSIQVGGVGVIESILIFREGASDVDIVGECVDGDRIGNVFDNDVFVDDVVGAVEKNIVGNNVVDSGDGCNVGNTVGKGVVEYIRAFDGDVVGDVDGS